MRSWDDLARLEDDDLVGAVVEAQLPELAADRETLFEILRVRFRDVTAAAYRATGMPRGLEEPFLEWLWDYERLFPGLSAYVARGRRGQLAGWLRKLAKWRAVDFARAEHRRGRRLVSSEAQELVAPEPEEPDLDLARDLERLRHATEELTAARRVPFKLVHFRELELTERDWREILRWCGRQRAEVESMLDGFRRSERARLTLEEVGALLGKSWTAMGQAVKRARDDLARALGGRGGPDA